MNSFSISLEPVDAKDVPRGVQVSFRSASDDGVEVVIVRHRPGPKGGKFEEESLGFVPTQNLARVLGAVMALTGGCGR